MSREDLEQALAAFPRCYGKVDDHFCDQPARMISVGFTQQYRCYEHAISGRHDCPAPWLDALEAVERAIASALSDEPTATAEELGLNRPPRVIPKLAALIRVEPDDPRPRKCGTYGCELNQAHIQRKLDAAKSPVTTCPVCCSPKISGAIQGGYRCLHCNYRWDPER